MDKCNRYAKSRQHRSITFKASLTGNAVEEEQLLKEWLGHDPEHQRYFERFRRHHIHLQAAIQSGRIQGQYIEFASRLKRRHIRRLFIRVAAIALILLGGGLSFYLIHTPSLIPTLAEVPIHPGSSKAILHLSSGTAIPVNTTSQELKEKDGTLIRISNEGVLNYAESANISTANLINRLEIPRGGEFKIKLADGTEAVSYTHLDVYKRQDIAIGNVVGSNIFNTFLIRGASAGISPRKVTTDSVTDLWVNIGVSVLLFIFVFTGKGRQINRWEGALFLTLYITYLTCLLYTSRCV